MNKTWTASILAALLPFSIWAADGSGDVSKTGQDTIAEVARIDGQDGAEEIVPVDLDAASEAYDIVLPQQPVHMTADSLVVRSADGYIQGRGNVDLRQGMDELHTSYIEVRTISCTIRRDRPYTLPARMPFPGQASFITAKTVMPAWIQSKALSGRARTSAARGRKWSTALATSSMA